MVQCLLSKNNCPLQRLLPLHRWPKCILGNIQMEIRTSQELVGLQKHVAIKGLIQFVTGGQHSPVQWM